MSQRNQNLSLKDDMTNLIASKEASNRSHTALNTCESIFKIFQYKKAGSTNRKDSRTHETGKKLRPTESCTWCGHG